MFLKVRKWSPYLRVDFVVVLLGPHPPPHQIVLDHMSGSQVVVSSLGDVTVLDDGEMKVTVEGLLGVRDILDLGYPTNGNLTASLKVRLRQCHSYNTPTDPGCLRPLLCQSSRALWVQTLMKNLQRKILFEMVKYRMRNDHRSDIFT